MTVAEALREQRGTNAYFIDGGEHYDPPEPPSRIVEIVIAPSPGRAKYLFWQRYERDLGEFVRDAWCEAVWLVQPNVHVEEGIVDFRHPFYEALWQMAEQQWPKTKAFQRMSREAAIGVAIRRGMERTS